MKTKKVSEWRKYDRKTNRWIQDFYIVYQFWFQFLQNAERDPTRTVDWTLYEGWGGANVVLGTPFRAWWLDRWIDLFSVEQPTDTCKFPLSIRQTKPTSYKVALRVYENRNKSNDDLYYYLAEKYQGKDMGSIDYDKPVETKDRTRFIKRYRALAERLLDNVCQGRFP